MTELASSGQLRAGLLRWALFFVPGILLLGLLSAGIGGSGPDNPWFESLIKPDMYPQPFVFSLVWSALYILMGLALAMIVCARGAAGRRTAIVLFAVQLALNLAWSPLFFGAHQLTASLVLILVLDLMVILTIVKFWAVRPVAAMLLAPYLAWILFASYLSWGIYVANPDADGQEVSGAATRIEF